MKTLEVQELRKMGSDKLHEELAEARKELFKARFEVRNNQAKNIHLIDKYRKYIARIKTLQRAAQPNQ